MGTNTETQRLRERHPEKKQTPRHTYTRGQRARDMQRLGETQRQEHTDTATQRLMGAQTEMHRH